MSNSINPPPNSAPQASIVVRCLNESTHIGRLFEALKKQSFTDFEVVVVDSGSTDGTLDIVAEQDARLVQIHPANFSFGRALNIGCRAARGDYLVFISAHCYPADNDWLASLVDGFNDPDVAVVYGRQQGEESTHFSEHRIFERWFPADSTPRQKGPFCNNANCAIRRDHWVERPYDEELPGLEDVAWAQEAVAAGHFVRYRADAAVVHVHNETSGQTRNRYRREAIALQRVFPQEHFNVLDFAQTYVANTVADAGEARRRGVLAREALGILRFRLAQFTGVYQGFHTRWPPTSSLKRHLYYPDDG